MKTRLGFVSNSSSSSYIIAVNSDKQSDDCPISVSDVLDIISKIDNGLEETELHSLGILIDDLNADRDRLMQERLMAKPPQWYRGTAEEWRRGSEDELQYINRKLRLITDAQASGRPVHYLSISYHERGIQNLFKAIREKGLIEVLWGDH
jgi:hypothetical protein